MASRLPYVLKNGVKFPRVVLGTSEMTLEEIPDVIEMAIRLGYRSINTAQMYNNEKEIGIAINRSSGKHCNREDIVLCSKIWPTHFKNVRETVLEQLKKLDLDYIDQYNLHWPIPYKDKGAKTFQEFYSDREIEFYPIYKVWEQMEAIKEEGLVKHIGVSNWNVALLTDMLGFAKHPPLVNEIEIHPYFPQPRMVDWLKEYGIHPTSFSTLGKPHQDGDFIALKARVIENETVARIAKKYNASVVQTLIAFGLNRGYTTIFQANQEQWMRENLDAQDLVLEPEDMAELMNLSQGERYVQPAVEYNYPLFD